MVLLIDSVASGNNTLDNAINVLYVSCVNETFLYLVISVIVTFLSFNYEQYIGSVGDLSSMKFVIIMFLCSNIAGNDCKPFEPEYTEFKSYPECSRYGYEYASELMNNFSDKFIDEYRTYIIFSCKEQATT